MQNSKKPAKDTPAMAAKVVAGRFQLGRYFLLTGLGLFIVVALALTYFEREQGKFFQDVQQKQSVFFKQVQEGFATQQDAGARRDLLTIHEAGNVNLTRLFANALWSMTSHLSWRERKPFLLTSAGRSPTSRTRRTTR